MGASASARRLIAGIAACSLMMGCSTTYMPRPSPRLHVIQRAGRPDYVRDGRVLEGGMFGGEIEEAVRGNSEAEAHARAYKSGMIGGFVASMLGAVAIGGGAGVIVVDAGRSSTSGAHDASAQTAGGMLLVGGLVAYAVGLSLLLNAQPHMWDAINIYNDGLPDALASSAPPPPGSPPYGASGAWMPTPATPPPVVPPPAAAPLPSARPAVPTTP